MNRRLGALGTILLSLLFTLAACDGGSTGVPTSSVASVRVAPAAETLEPGATLALRATAYDASGAALDERRFFWASSDTLVAAVTQDGVVESRGPGSAQVAASSGGASGFARIDVRSAAPASIELTPSSATLTAIADTVGLRARVFDASGHELSGAPVTWSSSASSVAAVASDGVVTAIANGVATITASTGAARATATLRVEQRVAALAVAPTKASVGAGDTVRLHATATDARGSIVAGAAITWSTSNAAVATVASNGVARGVAAGTATITAAAASATAAATLTVTASEPPSPPSPAPVASVEVEPSSAHVAVGGTVALSATLRDAEGHVLTGRAVAWTTSDASVATVSAAGLVTAEARGDATISATAEGVRGTATIHVSNTAAAVHAVSGSGQTAKNNATLAQPLVVRVVDAGGEPVAGVTVLWTTNNGAVSPSSTTTDAGGYAATRWTLGGGSRDEDRRAFATVVGLPAAVFTAKRD